MHPRDCVGSFAHFGAFQQRYTGVLVLRFIFAISANFPCRYTVTKGFVFQFLCKNAQRIYTLDHAQSYHAKPILLCDGSQPSGLRFCCL